MRRADGTGQTQDVLEMRGQQMAPWMVSPDGRLLFAEFSAQTGWDLLIASMVGSRVSEPLLATEYTEGRPRVSPNGRWLAYESTKTGQVEVYVVPYLDFDGGEILVSRGGGQSPVWSADGQTLYYLGPADMMEVTVDAEGPE